MAAAFGAVDAGGAAEFGGPDDEGIVEHAAAFEVAEETCDGLIDVAGVFGVFGHVAVLVPVVAGTAVDDFDEADSAFGHAAGDETLPSEAVGLAAFHAVES